MLASSHHRATVSARGFSTSASPPVRSVNSAVVGSARGQGKTSKVCALAVGSPFGDGPRSFTSLTPVGARASTGPATRRRRRRRLRVSSTARASATDENGKDAEEQKKKKNAEARSSRRYVNVTGFPFPLTPLLSRQTVISEVVPGRVWTLEQEQGIGLGLGVSTNVRMTVVKMSDGRLWIHDPVAPTEECVSMVGTARRGVARVID